MAETHGAASCRWATPTLFLNAPVWLYAWDCPWTCVRAHGPRLLTTTEICAACPRWEPRVEGSAELDQVSDERTDQPLFLDIFAG
jgi:hypothetical protein